MSDMPFGPGPASGNHYARGMQLPTGVVEARDLAAGDVILIRRPGASDRTPERIIAVSGWFNGTLVALQHDGFISEHSSKMPIALARIP